MSTNLMTTSTIAGIAFLALLLGVCSSSLEGGYVGSVNISSLDSSRQHWSETDESVFALVTEEAGMRAVEFSATGLISNCKLEVESRSKRGDLTATQTCEVTLKGMTEFLKVDYLSFTSASGVGPGGIIITIRGRTNGDKSVTIVFQGLPQEKK